MAMKLYSDVDIQDIADAIREVNGSSDTYKVSEMAAVIRTFTYEPVDLNLLTMNDGLINKRFNGSNTVSNMNGYFVTDHFAYSGGGLRIVKGNTNMGSISSANNYGNCRIGLYDANKTFIVAAYISHSDSSGNMGFTTDGDDLVCANPTATTAFSTDWSAVKYIRMTLALNGAASAIASVDDVLNSGMKIYAI